MTPKVIIPSVIYTENHYAQQRTGYYTANCLAFIRSSLGIANADIEPQTNTLVLLWHLEYHSQPRYFATVHKTGQSFHSALNKRERYDILAL